MPVERAEGGVIERNALLWVHRLLGWLVRVCKRRQLMSTRSSISR